MKRALNNEGARQRTKGSAAVEFAVLGLFFTTLLGIAMDFSRVFYAGIEVANAARAGAQYGISDPTHATDYAGMQTTAIADAPNVTGITATASQFCSCPDGSVTSCSGSGGCLQRRTYVKVVTNATFSTIGTYPFLPNPVPLSAQVTLRVK